MYKNIILFLTGLINKKITNTFRKNHTLNEEEKKIRSTREFDDIPFVKNWLIKQ